MATNNSSNSPLVGTTGTGTVLMLSQVPVPTTPILNGFTDGSSAASGVVGETALSTVMAASPTSISNNVIFDLTSLTLAHGDWELFGNMVINASSGILSFVQFWVNTTSATAPDNALQSSVSQGILLIEYGNSCPILRNNSNSTVTFYLSGSATITGTAVAFGNLFARRRY